MKSTETLDFGRTKVTTLFRKLFVPTMLGMVSVSAVTAIDGIFVGHGIGSDGIAAINLCIPLLMVLTGVGLMVGMGSSVMSSIYLSRGNIRMARAGITQALLMVTLVSVSVVAFIQFFPVQSARLLGSSEHLLPSVTDYLIWFSPSIILQLWITVAMFALRLDGSPKLAMWSSFIAAGTNVVFDWLFIFPLGWGVMGAALATTLSCVFGAAVAVIYLFCYAGNMRLHRLRGGVRGLQFFLRNIFLQCKIGSSALLGEATMAVLMFVGNQVFMHYWGDDGVGAFGVSCYYMPFVFMIGNAIAQSAQPIISYNFGMGCRERVHKALRVSLKTAIVYGLFSTAAFAVLPELLVGLFLPLDIPAARIAIAGFPYYGIAFVFFIFNLSSIGYFQSVERIKSATVFALLRGFVFLIPSFVWLPSVLGPTGIWLALPASEVLTTVSIGVTYWVARRLEQRKNLA